MKARVFFDAFAECLVNVAMARKYPALRAGLREVSSLRIGERHGAVHAEATGRMFDKLWSEAQKPEASK